jgi:hypothetical protein
MKRETGRLCVLVGLVFSVSDFVAASAELGFESSIVALEKLEMVE